MASRFAQERFDHVALFARTQSQLQQDKDAIQSAAQKIGRQVIVKTWQVDISDMDQLKAALEEVESFGTLECVYFNPARVGESMFFDFPTEKIESDFQVCPSLATADWTYRVTGHQDLCNCTVCDSQMGDALTPEDKGE